MSFLEYVVFMLAGMFAGGLLGYCFMRWCWYGGIDKFRRWLNS